MRRLLVIALCLLVSAPVWAEEPIQLAWMPTGILAGGGGGGAVCDAYDVNDTGLVGDDSYWQNGAARYYLGQSGWTPNSGTVEICKVCFYFRDITGDITGYTYHGYVCTMSSSSLDVCTEASTTVSGTTINSGGNDWYCFDFSSPYSVTAGTDYAVVFSLAQAPSGSNYLGIAYTPEDNIAGTVVGFYSDKAPGMGSSSDVAVRIYTK